MRRLTRLLLGIALAVAGAPCVAQTMPLSAFIPRAEALNAKGALALLSGDLKPIMAEGKAAFAAYRAQLEAERAGGHPSSCPPAGPLRVDSREFMTSLKTIPAADRATTNTAQGVAHFMANKYPCHH